MRVTEYRFGFMMPLFRPCQQAWSYTDTHLWDFLDKARLAAAPLMLLLATFVPVSWERELSVKTTNDIGH